MYVQCARTSTDGARNKHAINAKQRAPLHETKTSDLSFGLSNKDTLQVGAVQKKRTLVRSCDHHAEATSLTKKILPDPGQGRTRSPRSC
jgi:hypothetical protein